MSQTDHLIPERVQRCETAIAAYSHADPFTNLIDLMTDAMHWCDATWHDFHHALCIAGKHYIAERNEEQTEERRLP